MAKVEQACGGWCEAANVTRAHLLSMISAGRFRRACCELEISIGLCEQSDSLCCC
jgi:hypothetical protein